MPTMKRLRRWLVKLAAGASLLLCAVFVIAAIRSAFVLDHFIGPAWLREDKVNAFTLGGGGITSVRFRDISPAAPRFTEWTHSTSSPENSWDYWLGFQFRLTTTGWNIRIPYWSLVLLTGLPTLLLWYRHCRKLRKAEMIGKCTVCGYDLRATPDRCPECGTIP